MFKQLVERLTRTRQARHKGERDAPAEMGQPTSRETGGGSAAPTQDTHSSTGTTSSETFVGRAGGDEAGDVSGTGGEARSAESDLDDQGAGRRQ